MTDLLSRKLLLPVCLICVASILTPDLGSAGTYIFASEDNGLDIITHPSGYTGSGGVLDVKVCIDASATNAVAMEIPVQNIVKQINYMSPVTPNLFLYANNNIPSGALDFESLALHELGHCTGLGHPNLGSQTGVSGADTDYTMTGDGANDTYAFDAGTDTVIGSSDDQRDDDQNLHWFSKDVNNPFLEVASPQSSNYSRDVADLPESHDFPANADRSVGALLGFDDTEAVMQQGQFSDEDQRSLQADDVATYRMGMTGLDEIASTADDYTINMVFGGIKADTSSCDIVIESSTSGFGVCSTGATFLNATHLSITSATFTYNSGLTWFFNPVAICTVGDDTLTYSNTTHSDTRSHNACTSITYGPDYTIGANGDVTATAPTIILGPGTTINGTFAAITLTP